MLMTRYKIISRKENEERREEKRRERKEKQITKSHYNNGKNQKT